MAQAPYYSRDALRAAFHALLPRGRAWPKEVDTALDRTIDALLVEPERTTARAGQLIAEGFPATTAAMLPEWEAALGLPDPCQGPAPTLQARRGQVVARFSSDGGQAVPHLVRFAKLLGYDVTVKEYWPSKTGNTRAGKKLMGQGCQFVLRFDTAQPTRSRVFRAGMSAAGEHLLSFGDNVLQCELNAIRPAHAVPVYAYGAVLNPIVPEVPAGEAVTVTIASQPTSYRVYQRTAATGSTFDKGSRQLPFDVTLSAAATSLEYRLRDFNAPATTLVPWSSLGARPSGTQTINLNFPASDKWYVLDFRTNANDSTIASTTNRFAVGDLWVHGGQSQQVNNILAISQNQSGQNATSLGLTAHPAAAVNVVGNNGTLVSTGWGPLVPGGSALQASSPYLVEFTNRMIAASGVVTAVCGYALGATAIAVWDNALDTPMQGAIGFYSSFVREAAGYCWFLGGTDAQTGTTKAAYKAALTAHWQLVRSVIQFPMGNAIDVVPMGARTADDATGGTESSVEAIRQACLEWVSENSGEAGIAYSWSDSPLFSDQIHQTGAGAILMAQRYALTAQKRLGLRTTDARGPVVTAATRASGSNVVNLTVQLNGGTLLQKRNTALPVDGIEVFTAGTATPWAISNVNFGAVTGSTAIVNVTLASTPANTVALDVYATYGRDADNSAAIDNFIYDNQSVPGSSLPGLPLAGNSKMATVSPPGATGFPTLGGKVVWRMSALNSANLGLTGSTVTAIKDVSGLGAADLVYTGDSGQNATYASSGGANNQPYLDFGSNAVRGNAASDYSANLGTLQAALTGAAQKFHIFSVTYGYSDATDSSAVFVVENTSSGGFANHITQWQATNGSNTLGLQIRGDPSNSGAVNDGGAQSYNFGADAWHVLEGRYDGGQVTAWVDGVQQNGALSATFDCGDGALTGVNATRIGSRTSAGTKARNLRGRLSEVIVCSDVLTTAERTALINYLNSTYGLAAV